MALLAALWTSPVPELFWHFFCTTSEPDVLTLCANRLAGEPPDTLVDKLVTRLPTETYASRAMLIAQMLSRQADLAPTLRVRIAALAPVEAAPPPWGDEVLEDWLCCLHDEMPFPTSQKARALLVSQKSEGALDWLSTHWDRLRDEVKLWLVSELRERAELVAKAFREPGLAGRLAEEVTSLDCSLVDWRALWDGDLRFLALRYGAERPDPSEDWERAARDEERVELLRRYPTRLDWMKVARQGRPAVRSAALQVLEAQSSEFRSDVLARLLQADGHEEVALFRALANGLFADAAARA